MHNSTHSTRGYGDHAIIVVSMPGNPRVVANALGCDSGGNEVTADPTMVGSRRFSISLLIIVAEITLVKPMAAFFMFSFATKIVMIFPIFAADITAKYRIPSRNNMSDMSLFPGILANIDLQRVSPKMTTSKSSCPPHAADRYDASSELRYPFPGQPMRGSCVGTRTAAGGGGNATTAQQPTAIAPTARNTSIARTQRSLSYSAYMRMIMIMPPIA